MLSRQEIKKWFVQFLSYTSSLPNNGHIYLSTRQIGRSEIEEFIQNSSSNRIKVVTDLKKLAAAGWLGAVYCSQKEKQYDVYFLSSSGEISLLLMTGNIEEIETELAPISDWDGVRNLLGSAPELESFTQTMHSVRLPQKVEKLEPQKSNILIWWQSYRETIEQIFVAILAIGLTIFTWQAWFHWLVALGVFLSFCYLQINFENQKRNPQTCLQNYFYLYGKEACWIILFIATQSYSGLLSPLLTMMYAPYRKLAEKLK
jgi:hypothetical protein